MLNPHESSLGDLASSLNEVGELIPDELALRSVTLVNMSRLTLDQATGNTAANIHITGARDSLAAAERNLRKAAGLLRFALGGILRYTEHIGSGVERGLGAEAVAVIHAHRDAMEQSAADTQSGLYVEDGEIREHAWGTDNSPLSEYDSDFAYVLGGETIVNLVRGKEDVCVVDLMSSTTAVRDLLGQLPPVRKRGFALRLSEVRTDEEKAADEALDIKQQLGDITAASTLEKTKGDVGEGNADIVMMHAVGGGLNLPPSWIYYRRLMRSIWYMLSPNGGTALLQIPSTVYMLEPGDALDNWIAEARANGIQVEHVAHALRITKTPNSPTRLPM